MRKELEQRITEALEALAGTRTIPISGLLRAATNRLAYVLAAGAPGDELTDDDIKRIANVEEQKVYTTEQSAIKHCRHAHDVWWQRATGQGRIVCLTSEGRLSFAGSDVRSAGKRARRAVKAANVTDIPEALIPKRDTVLAQAGAMATIAHATTAKRLLGETKKAPPEIDQIRALMEKMG